MKGIVFNVFEAFIETNWGEEAYEDLLQDTPLVTKDPFIGPGTYPDEDLLALVTKACERFGVSPPDALRAFGKFMFPHLAGKVPQFVEGHDPKSFLLSVHNVIHVEVRKLFPESVTPTFEYEDESVDTLTIHYTSARQLCHLMEGLLDGVGEHFDTDIAREHTACMHSGADRCRFDLRFATRKAG